MSGLEQTEASGAWWSYGLVGLAFAAVLLSPFGLSWLRDTLARGRAYRARQPRRPWTLPAPDLSDPRQTLAAREHLSRGDDPSPR